MIRMLIFLVTIVMIAGLVTLVANVDGVVYAQIGDYDFSARSVILIFALMFLAGLCIFGTLILSWLARIPKRLKRTRLETQRSKGLTALARGLEAVAAGDAEDAQRHAKNASKNLDRPGLTRLLTAQAAQLAGDHAIAQENYAGMLEAPETEFLGLKGLYLQARDQKDKTAAKEYAERAFKLRPGAEWAFNSVYHLSLERGAWGEALDALQLAQKNGVPKDEPNQRREAALLSAAAYAAHASEDNAAALKEAEAAFKKAPSFTPAAILLAKLLSQKGNDGKAAKVLEEAWAAAPHPAIVRTLEKIFADAPSGRRAGRLLRLAEKAPDKDESLLVRAEQHIALEDWDAAIQDLETLASRNPTASTFSAMAAAMTGKYDEKSGAPWLAKAAAAPLDSTIGRDGEFHFTTDGWRRLIEEFATSGRLAPPPLENVSFAMTRGEVKLLTAAPEVKSEEQPIENEPAEEVVDVEPETPIEKPEAEKPSVAESKSDNVDAEIISEPPAADYVVSPKKS